MYRNIVDQIVQVVKDEGYVIQKRDPSRPYVKAHGIDTKKSATDFFFAPCQANDPEGTFFKDYNGKGREPIHVESWIEWSILSDAPPRRYVPSVSIELTDEQIAIKERLLNEWQTQGVLPGNGDSGIWKLFTGLRSARIPKDHIRAILHEAADMANSPRARKKQVDRIVRDEGL